MALNTKIKDIEDAIVQKIIDGAIVGVNGIIFNRELRNGVKAPPYIWIFPDPSPIDSLAVITISEDWLYRFTLMAVAASYASQDQDQARDIALQASGLFIPAPRTLGGLVSDVVRTAWDSDFTKELPTEQLFGAAVAMEARFINREV